MKKFSDSEILDLMREQIEAREFNSISHTYIDEYINISSLEDDEYLVSNKEQTSELLEAMSGDKEISSLKILSRSDIENFITISFTYKFKAKIGKIDMSGSVEGITVFLVSKEGLLTVFDAQSNV